MNDATNHYSTIVLHIPHAGTAFFGTDIHHRQTLIDNARDVIDWYTDELFTPRTHNPKIESVVFPFCRIACDVERLINDPMEAKNLGICYDTHVHLPQNGFFEIDGVWLERKHMQELSHRHYVQHHRQVEELIFCNPNSLLIDCHSFSSVRTPLSSDDVADSEISDIDICIGFNDDETCPSHSTIATIEQHFSEAGYKVGINTPFSNSKTFNCVKSYKSVMIELNKKCYMNETTLERNANFESLHQLIVKLYDKLL